MQDEPQAALITGLFGTGKSSVAIEMADGSSSVVSRTP